MSGANPSRTADLASKQVIGDGYAVKTAAATLAVYETRINANTTAGAMAITLPPVAMAAGNFYSIILGTDGGDLTIQDQDDSYNWDDLTCDDALDGYLLYSDGFNWWTMGAKTA